MEDKEEVSEEEPRAKKEPSMKQFVSAVNRKYGKDALYQISKDRVIVQVKENEDDVTYITHVHVFGKSK